MFCLLGLQGDGGGLEGGTVLLACVCVCVRAREASPVPHPTPGRQERASWGGRRWGRACFSQMPHSISPFQAGILVLDNLGVREGTAAATSAN